MERSVLSVRGIKKSFGMESDAPVLKEITVSFTQGTSYAIMGVSGTGKSTLMHLLAGLDTPTAGTVFFNEQNIFRMSVQEHAYFLRSSVGLLFQLPYLIKELSVCENVMLPALIAGGSEANSLKKAQHLLECVGLTQKADARPGSLSGGQQQRVALARALINEPAFLLADEPTGNLDERTGAEMVDLLLRLQREWQMGLIVSTHDAHVAERMEHRYRLHEGMLFEQPYVQSSSSSLSAGADFSSSLS